MPARSFGPFTSDGIPVPAGARVQLRVIQTSGVPRNLAKLKFGVAQLEPKGSGGLLLPKLGVGPPPGPPLVLGSNIAWQQSTQPRAQVRLEVDGSTVARTHDLLGTALSAGKITWHPTANRIVFLHGSGPLYEVFDADAEVIESGWPNASGSRVYAACWRPDASKLLLAHNASHGFDMIDVETQTIESGWPSISAQWSNAWSPNGEQFISGSTGSQGLRLIDFGTKSVLMQDTDANAPRAVVYSPDGSMFAAGGTGYVRVYNSDGTLVTDVTPDGGAAVVALAWSPNGDRLAVGTSADPYLRMLETDGWTWEAGWPGLAGAVRMMSWWGDASRLAVMHANGADDVLSVVNATDKTLETGWPNPSGGALGVVFINDPANVTAG